MFKKITLICALLGAVCFLMLPAYAEVQNIKVSGDITALGVYRDNYDLEDANVIGVGGVNAPNANTQDADSMFASIIRLQVEADLTDNVAARIRLANLREWDTVVAATNDTDINLDLAYVTLKEMLYSPLTLVIGRQELNYGKGLIVGYGRYQDPDNQFTYDDLSPMHGYDAVRAILDYDPWTLELLMVKLNESDDDADAVAAGKDSDTDFYGVNLGYRFPSNEAEMEGYFFAERDQNYNLSMNDPANDVLEATYEEANVYCAGLRGSLVPMENLTLAAELAGQWGKIKDEDQADAPNPPNSEAKERDIRAMAANAAAEYKFANVRFAPKLGLEYLYLSGEELNSDATAADSEARDTGNFGAWFPLLRGKKLGDIRDCLETLYVTNDDADTSGWTNQHTIKVSGGLNLGELVDGLSLDLAYLHYWFDEVPSYTGRDDEIGDEINMKLTYDYTEDVQFALNGALFLPGDYYNNIHNINALSGGSQNRDTDRDTGRVSNDKAVSLIGSCRVMF